MASFCWMAMEGLELYLKLVMVFETTHSLLPIYFSVGYGVPVIIVAVAAGLFPQGYGTETSCWLSKERGFHWSFVGPVLCVMAFNTINLVIALTVMCRHFKKKGGEEMQRMAQFRRSFKGASALVCIMGITWIFGPLDFADEPTAEVFAYIFVVLTGTQGLFIFIFHCVTNDQVQKQYRRVLRSADWLPESCRRGLLIIVARRPSADVSTTVTRSTASSMARRQTENLDERMITQSLSLASIPEESYDTEDTTDALGSTATNTTQPADGTANTAQTADCLAIAVKPAEGRDTSNTTDPAKDTPEIAPTAEQSTSSLLPTVTDLQPTNAPADNTTSDPPTETP